MRYPLQKRLERLAADRWSRRGLRTLLRSAWLGLSVLCIGLGLNLLFGLDIAGETLIALALGCVGIGALLLLRRQLAAHDVARRLDQRFGLNEELTTALEVSNRGEEAEGVAQRLIEHAYATTGKVQQYVARNRRQPWADVLTLAALALLCLGMFVLLGLGPLSEPPAAEPLPELVPPEEVAQQEEQQQEEQQQQEQQQSPGLNNDSGQSNVAQSSSALDQQAASALADALRDQSATRPAADALDQGDVSGAAQSLRELADQGDQLSSETRRNLADELRAAAAQIEQDNPAMAEQIRDSAYGLRQSEDRSGDALENLADTVEQLDDGNQPGEQAQQSGDAQAGQQSGGNQPSGGPSPPVEQRERSHERLGVDGVPLELESQGDGNVPTEGDPETMAAGGGSGSFETGQQPVSDETVQVDEDPLRIPADLRDVVQEYFSPVE
jgi:hypothetical protein